LLWASGYGILWNISLPAGVIAGPRSNKRDKVMKMLVSGFALALALAFSGGNGQS
jgi:hypothetical protein